jgi:hypothetical protein
MSYYEPVVAHPDLPTCSSLLMLALTYLSAACRLDQCDIDPIPDCVARLRYVINCLLPPVRAY